MNEAWKSAIISTGIPHLDASGRDMCITDGWNSPRTLQDASSIKMVLGTEGKGLLQTTYSHASLPISTLESLRRKTDTYSPDDGLPQQALDYANMLDLPFAASSNGEAFVFHDKTGLLFDGDIERMLSMDQFPDRSTLVSAFFLSGRDGRAMTRQS